MISIKLISQTGGDVRLGQPCRFRLRRAAQGLMTRAFVKHKGVFYLKPLSDWSDEDEITFFPEAPGAYNLVVQWRDADGHKGWSEKTFEVKADRDYDSSPDTLKAWGKTKMWVLSQWETNLFKGYEKGTIDLLPQIIKPGSVVYDVGANLGFYAIPFARLAGPDGRVFCIEANPLCAYFLRANLERNRVDNAEILPVALLNRPGKCDFTINYDNSGIGITEAAGFYPTKIGHEISVQALSFDALLEDYDLPLPDVVKIDIEGAEEMALAGMERTLSLRRPTFILELHGQGAATGVMNRLKAHLYRYREMSAGREFDSAEAFLDWFPDTVLQVLAFPE